MADALATGLTFVLGLAAFAFVIWYVHWDTARLQRRWDDYRAKHYPGLSESEALDRYLWEGSPWY